MPHLDEGYQIFLEQPMQEPFHQDPLQSTFRLGGTNSAAKLYPIKIGHLDVSEERMQVDWLELLGGDETSCI
jgi:hypothetical protein